MVSPINSQISSPKTTKTSIFYVNDVHSNVENIERLKTASNQFDSFTKSQNADALKLSAGDFCLGTDVNKNNYDIFAQNSLGITASAVGNHEFDLVKKNLVSVLSGNSYKLLAANLDIPETSDENKEIKKAISNSYIQEQNGTKYGIIGLSPIDLALHFTHPQEYADFKVPTVEKTAEILQKEVDKLKEQGVDKVIVLSHSGNIADKVFAQTVEGIDVIVGGHSHDLVQGLKEGENLFYSKKTGEPTIITQAGRDGKYFGVLNLEFNDKGVVVSAQNNVMKTEDFKRNPVMRFFTDKFFGKPNVVGKVNSAEKADNILISENPSASFVLDSMKNELGVDIALMNSANMRGRFDVGEINDRDLAEMSPFQNEVCILKLSEAEVVNALKVGAKSITHPFLRPGITQVSGLKYTMTKDGQLKEARFVDKDGKETPIDIQNPDPNKIYRATVDSYMARGGNDYLPNKIDEVEKMFDFDKDKLVKDHIKRLNKPLDIKHDGRITVVDA